MHSEITRILQAEHPFNFGFILLQAGHAAARCKCGKLSCTACGFTRFHQRVRQVASKRITGLLTGGVQNKELEI